MTAIYNRALQDLDFLAFLDRWVPFSRPIVIADLLVLAHSPGAEWAMIWDKNQESQDENMESGNLKRRGRRRPGEAWSINGLKSRGIETFVWLSTIFSAMKSILQKIIIWFIWYKLYQKIVWNHFLESVGTVHDNLIWLISLYWEVFNLYQTVVSNHSVHNSITDHILSTGSEVNPS